MTDRISVTKSSPSTSFYLEADRTGASGNSSNIRCYLRAENEGNSSSNFGDSGYQYGSIDGYGEFGRRTADPFLPGGYGTGAQRWRVGPYNVLIPHDSNGYGPTITLRMGLVYGSISESHTAQLALPRIARVPLAPTMRTPTDATSTSFKTSFSSNGDGGNAINEWQLQIATNSAFTTGVETFNSPGTMTLTGRTPGTQYWMRARGNNDIGWGTYSNVETITTLGGPAQPPTDLILLTILPSTINADWVAPVDTGGKPITGYDVQIATDPAFTTGLQMVSTAAAVTDANISGLVTAVPYWIRVRAKNVDAIGEWSGALQAMIPAGGKAWTGSAWKASQLKAWTGSIWKSVILKAWDGTTWKLTK